MRGFLIGAIIFSMLCFNGCGGGNGDSAGNSNNNNDITPASTAQATILAANDLGMHCIDREFSVFSILPPFNVVNTQIIKRESTGRPYLANPSEVDAFYDAAMDANGSINAYSLGKTDFWQFANSLFSVSLQAGQGLTGLFMPGDSPLNKGPQPMEYHLTRGWFSAEGIPITPLDDSLQANTYPLMTISAHDASSGALLANVDIVVPVATETDCQNCHLTGGIAAQTQSPRWSNNPDLEVQSKINVLILHDISQGTALENAQPVLCAQCHYSPALDLAGTGPSGGQTGIPFFSKVMHEFHGGLLVNNDPVFPPDGPVQDTCYQCHPGKITQCQRGAMKTGGMECNECHGGMLAVGGAFPLAQGGSIDGTNDGGTRRPWQDLPRCQSCHTGDAVSYLTGPNLTADPNWPFRLRQAFASGDSSASPLLADNKRFAEDTNTLYRFSRGHGEVFCEGCHGSTHAVWPNQSAGANDNTAAMMLQGFIGTITECGTCHQPGSLPLTADGPHGLHNVNDRRWFDHGHSDFYGTDRNSCKACHGQDLTGTPLAKMPTARIFRIESSTVTYAKGDLVRCDRCHGRPSL